MRLTLDKRIIKFALVSALTVLLGGFRHMCSSGEQCVPQLVKTSQNSCQEHCGKSSSKSKSQSAPCCPKSLCGIQQSGLPASNAVLLAKADFSIAWVPVAEKSLYPIALFTPTRVIFPPGWNQSDSGFPSNPHNHSPPHYLV